MRITVTTRRTTERTLSRRDSQRQTCDEAFLLAAAHNTDQISPELREVSNPPGCSTYPDLGGLLARMRIGRSRKPSGRAGKRTLPNHRHADIAISLLQYFRSVDLVCRSCNVFGRHPHAMNCIDAPTVRVLKVDRAEEEHSAKSEEPDAGFKSFPFPQLS